MILEDKTRCMKPIVLLFSVLLCFVRCHRPGHQLVKLNGKAQGTTYHIVYVSDDAANYQQGVDSILRRIDTSMSTYLPGSIISRMNANDSTARADSHFSTVFTKAMEVSQITQGIFDVTIAPLVNAWGFGFSKKESVDSLMIDSLINLVGYPMLKLEGDKLVKDKPQVSLDFNAIAQGYTVDVLCRYLEDNGVANYLVELGGELKAKGTKSGEPWQIGIDRPEENKEAGRPLQAVISLHNRALATSGNYRKFYEEGGEKFAHIIDPETGYPARQNIMSATVLADDCMTADAYATVFMIMGLQKSKVFLEQHPQLNLEVFFVYTELGKWKIYSSPTLEKQVKEVN